MPIARCLPLPPFSAVSSPARPDPLGRRLKPWNHPKRGNDDWHASLPIDNGRDDDSGARGRLRLAGGRGRDEQAGRADAHGLVDLEQLQKSLNESAQRNIELEQKKKQFQQELDQANAKIKQMREELGLLPEDDPSFTQRLVELAELDGRTKAKAQLYQSMLEREQAKLLREMYDKITAAIGDLAEKDGYDIVLLDDRKITIPANYNADQVNASILQKRLLYAGGADDITDQIITKMNAEFGTP
jgi:Skp family chaperone for outer membrane proteins